MQTKSKTIYQLVNELEVFKQEVFKKFSTSLIDFNMCFNLKDYQKPTNGYEVEITITRLSDNRVMRNYICTAYSNLEQAKAAVIVEDLNDRIYLHPITKEIVNKGYLTSGLYSVKFNEKKAGSYKEDQKQFKKYLNSLDLGDTGGRNWIINGLTQK